MATNDITGDRLVSKAPTDTYRNNYDAIFSVKKCNFCGLTLKDPCTSLQSDYCEKALVINKETNDSNLW